jgi:hypothetical protein
MSNSLWVDTVRRGLAAARPTVPDIPANTFCWYYETDTTLMKMWNGSAWVTSYAIPTSGLGSVPSGIAATAVATETGSGIFRQTTITLTALAQTITNGASEWVGTDIYDFPAGRILILGVIASLAPTTTSTIASTIASGATGAIAVGTVTDDGTHSTTKVDLLPDTAYTSSTTINVAAAAVTAALAASAQFDGTATAKKAFLNNKIATGSGDGTMTWTGYVTITWVNLGDY